MGKILFVALFLSSCSSVSRHFKLETPRDQKVKIAWIKNMDPPYESGNLPIAQNSLAIHRSHVFVGDAQGYFYSIRKRDGWELWRRRETSAIVGTPLVHDNAVIYGNEAGRLFSRNRHTGELNYSVDLASATDGKIVVYKGRGFVHTRNHKIITIDILTGKILWSYRRSHSFMSTLHQVSVPIIFRNTAIVGTADGFVIALSVEDGRVLWESKVSSRSKFADADIGPYLWKRRLFASSIGGPLVELNPNNGMLIHKYPFEMSHRPIYHNDKMILGTLQGKVIKVNNLGKVVKSVEMPKRRAVMQMTLWQGYLVAALAEGRIVFLNPETFEFHKFLDLGHSYSDLYSPFETDKEYLGFLTGRNNLYMLRKN